MGNNPVNFVDPYGLSSDECGRYKICSNIPKERESSCKKVVDWACGYMPHYCCKVDFDSCVSDIDDTGQNFQDKWDECYLKLASCTAGLD